METTSEFHWWHTLVIEIKWKRNVVGRIQCNWLWCNFAEKNNGWIGPKRSGKMKRVPFNGRTCFGHAPAVFRLISLPHIRILFRTPFAFLNSLRDSFLWFCSHFLFWLCLLHYKLCTVTAQIVQIAHRMHLKHCFQSNDKQYSLITVPLLLLLVLIIDAAALCWFSF